MSKEIRGTCEGTGKNLHKEEPTKEGIHKILQERGKIYGKFRSHAEITQKFKAIALWYMLTNMTKFSASQKEAIDMIFHKLGRILNGDPNYVDSWVDIVGYAQLVVNELEGEKKK